MCLLDQRSRELFDGEIIDGNQRMDLSSVNIQKMNDFSQNVFRKFSRKTYVWLPRTKYFLLFLNRTEKSIVRPLIKTEALDPDEPSNYNLFLVFCSCQRHLKELPRLKSTNTVSMTTDFMPECTSIPLQEVS